jgi:hypothetical protein
MALAGCATPSPPISTPFDQEHATRLLAPGPNTVKGSALIRQRGGGVVTCAGSAVALVPATAYARQRMVAIYGNAERGALGSGWRGDSPTGYRENIRLTVCDAQGFFGFDQVADGEFFVTTSIRWSVGNSAEGGNLMQRTLVMGGKTTSLVLAP